jgi:hypothetical protein
MTTVAPIEIAGCNAKRVSIAFLIEALAALGREIVMDLPGIVFSQRAVMAGSKAEAPPLGLSAG